MDNQEERIAQILVNRDPVEMHPILSGLSSLFAEYHKMRLNGN